MTVVPPLLVVQGRCAIHSSPTAWRRLAARITLEYGPDYQWW